jgi:hypothetical protein
MSTPLLGPSEKAELESMMYECLLAHYRVLGGPGLLGHGLHLVVSPSGVTLEKASSRNCLAQVEIRQLFTAVCYLAGDAADSVMPEDALKSLATEATNITAAQINKLA